MEPVTDEGAYDGFLAFEVGEVGVIAMELDRCSPTLPESVLLAA
jgi:hypothetical protein